MSDQRSVRPELGSQSILPAACRSAHLGSLFLSFTKCVNVALQVLPEEPARFRFESISNRSPTQTIALCEAVLYWLRSWEDLSARFTFHACKQFLLL